ARKIQLCASSVGTRRQFCGIHRQLCPGPATSTRGGPVAAPAPAAMGPVEPALAAAGWSRRVADITYLAISIGLAGFLAQIALRQIRGFLQLPDMASDAG
ncbi:hypothetical protein TSOC_014612, partial [Tetrabaena socialis]